ncbi:hypothetical protein [Tsukamurella spumae]|uniref:Uncharacterized protein n=1 Tax=Tsukamurella spumae TaxID=44753 RepID=A0A846X2Y0_9ACTN|nr:hypothetical protein [Tsukamurella spumae]NKY19513.1 hypothetical protein [Tsukamurella spumae]
MFDPRVWQERTPPRPVRVSITRALPRLAHFGTRADRTPLWIRAGGVHLEHTMDGEVIGVCRLDDGQWLVNVRIRPRVGQEGIATMTTWVTADAVSSWPDDQPRSTRA